MSATSATGKSLKIAILAMGGEGGGVLADWIVDMAEHARLLSRRPPRCPASRSAPARPSTTSSSSREIGDAGQPVLALMPSPGDVDVVLASELMEAGRAVQRGLVTPDRTTLIASTHRVYSITEKTRDGRRPRRCDGAARRAAAAAAQRFVRFDMARAAEDSGSVISAVLFGALAGTGALPFAATRPSRQRSAAAASACEAEPARASRPAAGIATHGRRPRRGASADGPPPAAGGALPLAAARRVASSGSSPAAAPSRTLLAEACAGWSTTRTSAYAALYLDRLAPHPRARPRSRTGGC